MAIDVMHVALRNHFSKTQTFSHTFKPDPDCCKDVNYKLFNDTKWHKFITTFFISGQKLFLYIQEFELIMGFCCHGNHSCPK